MTKGVLNRHELRKALDEAAQAIGFFDSPKLKAGWVTFLLEALDETLDDPELEATLEHVRDAIETRLEIGRW
jgi:hypothetical protein